MSTVPVGGILWWSGTLVDCPADYQVCDGTNGTPDLRDKFVIGAGGAYAVGDTGGQATQTIPAHDHAVDADSQHLDEFGNLAGRHAHHLESATDSTTPTPLLVHPYGGSPVPDLLWDGAAHDHPVNWNVLGSAYDVSPDFGAGQLGQGAHDHHVTGPTAGVGDKSTSNIPSWYALFYIMKIL